MKFVVYFTRLFSPPVAGFIDCLISGVMNGFGHDLILMRLIVRVHSACLGKLIEYVNLIIEVVKNINNVKRDTHQIASE